MRNAKCVLRQKYDYSWEILFLRIELEYLFSYYYSWIDEIEENTGCIWRREMCDAYHGALQYCKLISMHLQHFGEKPNGHESEQCNHNKKKRRGPGGWDRWTKVGWDEDGICKPRSRTRKEHKQGKSSLPLPRRTRRRPRAAATSIGSLLRWSPLLQNPSSVSSGSPPSLAFGIRVIAGNGGEDEDVAAAAACEWRAAVCMRGAIRTVEGTKQQIGRPSDTEARSTGVVFSLSLLWSRSIFFLSFFLVWKEKMHANGTRGKMFSLFTLKFWITSIIFFPETTRTPRPFVDVLKCFVARKKKSFKQIQFHLT